MKGKFLFLGTGASMGLPVIGCTCKVCQSKNPKDQRLRTSGLLTINNRNILIDCGPDFRQQALLYKIMNLDGVILTHAHQDHTGGIDELRAYYSHTKKSLPCLMSEETFRDLYVRFNYIFAQKKGGNKLLSKLIPQLLTSEEGSIKFLEIETDYFSYMQAGMKVNGFRWGNFAYVTDICDYKEEIFESLEGIETLVISALRYSNSYIHFTVDQAVEFSEKIGAKRTFLTHISHDLSHEETNAYLLGNVELAFDGMEIEFDL